MDVKALIAEAEARLNAIKHGDPSLGASPMNVDQSAPRHAPPTGKYPFVGQRYYGEFPNYDYDPYRDTYVPKFKDWRNYQYSSGLLQKPPSYAEQALKSIVAPAAVKSIFGDGLAKVPENFLGLPKNIVNSITGGKGDYSSIFGSSGAPVLDYTGTYEPVSGAAEHFGGTTMEPTFDSAGNLTDTTVPAASESAGSFWDTINPLNWF